MQKSKKAQIEISFNWILILIIGGAFILIFSIIGNAITKDAEQQSDVITSKKLETILTAAQNNEESIKKLDRLEYEIEFLCSQNQTMYKRANKESTLNNLETTTIYSPKTLGDTQLKAWSYTFQAPFPIATTLMLTDEKTMYIFQDEPIIQKIKQTIPPEINIMTTENIELQTDEGHRKYVYITKTKPTAISQSLKTKLTTIQIESENIFEQGTLKFITYKKDAEIETQTNYVTQHMLIGAIISGDATLYECTKNQILLKQKIKTKIIQQRAKEIQKSYQEHPELPGSATCTYFYESLLQEPLNSIIENSTQIQNQEKLNNYLESIKDLELLNDELRIKNCPRIY